MPGLQSERAQPPARPPGSPQKRRIKKERFRHVRVVLSGVSTFLKILLKSLMTFFRTALEWLGTLLRSVVECLARAARASERTGSAPARPPGSPLWQLRKYAGYAGCAGWLWLCVAGCGWLAACGDTERPRHTERARARERLKSSGKS